MGDDVKADIKFSIIPEWVLDADISDRAVRVYAVLARYADNDTLTAFPSRATLAKRLRCVTRSVDRALSELESIGAIVKHSRHDEVKGNASNLYVLRRIPTDPSDTTVAPLATQESPPWRQESRPPSDTTVALTITRELDPEELDIDMAFDTFWSAYPRRTAKGRARTAFEKALKKTSLKNILQAVELYTVQVEDKSIEYVAHPATWLNGERWDDDYANEIAKRRGNKREPNYVEGVRLVAKYQQMEGRELE